LSSYVRKDIGGSFVISLPCTVIISKQGPLKYSFGLLYQFFFLKDHFTTRKLPDKLIKKCIKMFGHSILQCRWFYDRSAKGDDFYKGKIFLMPPLLTGPCHTHRLLLHISQQRGSLPGLPLKGQISLIWPFWNCFTENKMIWPNFGLFEMLNKISPFSRPEQNL